MPPIRVTLARAQGSTPRAAGTAMMVHADRIDGTIGGGALEWEAMRHARRMIDDGTARSERVVPLGPALGQCCGGSVTLLFEAADRLPREGRSPLWVWGAGHVGRAVVATLAPLPGIAITWIDTDPGRFPRDVPKGVVPVVAADPPRLMPRAPDAARHLILTYGHDIDLALCHAALARGFATCGLIGSATKWARFRKRLGALGHAEAQISRIDCPIGVPSLGKHPQAIAVGVAWRLLDERRRENAAHAARARCG